MNLSKRQVTFFITALLCVSVSGQISLKKAKDMLTSKKEKTNNSNPCDNNGSVNIDQSSKAFTMYKNVEKQLDLAESFVDRGLMSSAAKNLGNAKKYLGYVLKKEPNANLSELCDRLMKLKGNADSGANDKDDFNKITYFLNRYYRTNDSPAKPEQFGFLYGEFIEKANAFNRTEVLNKANSSNDSKAKETISILQDYSAFIDRQGIVEHLMGLLDEVNDKSPDQLAQKANDVKQVALGLKNIAGDNKDINRLIAFADKQLGKADSKLAGVYTSDFHKKNVNKVVFTKERFVPGNESTVEVNPTFKPGDAIYGTIYLAATIKEAVSSWKGYGKGGTMSLEVEDSKGDFLNRRFESWEVSSYSNYEVSISDATNKDQTYVQFVLIPNSETDLSVEMKCHNITPILMARGLSMESERLKKYEVEIKSSGSKTGFVRYNGSFKIDLADGEGPAYYTKAENVQMDKLLEANPLPTAKLNNSALESQLLTEMNKQGFQEQFIKTYIQRDWQLFEPLLETPYKEMKASFTYKTSEGKCGWQTYSFRSFKTGSGWSNPQKWGGADQRQRLSCKKFK